MAKSKRHLTEEGLSIHAYTSCQNIFLVWTFAERIPDCIGMSLIRKHEDDSEPGKVLESSVGFADDPEAMSGKHRPSTEWPFQRCTWNDWTAPRDAKVVYQVRAVMQDGNAGPQSSWSNAVQLTDEPDHRKLSAFFNDGVIATQWVARALEKETSGSFVAAVKEPGTQVRARLPRPRRWKAYHLLAMGTSYIVMRGQWATVAAWVATAELDTVALPVARRIPNTAQSVAGSGRSYSSRRLRRIALMSARQGPLTANRRDARATRGSLIRTEGIGLPTEWGLRL